MKKFIIPVMWTMTADMEIEAETIEEAKQIAIDASLPNGHYVDNSFEINEEIIPILNELTPAAQTELTDDQYSDVAVWIAEQSDEDVAKWTAEFWPGKTTEEITALEESMDEIMGAEHSTAFYSWLFINKMPQD